SLVSDWSQDVCFSDLSAARGLPEPCVRPGGRLARPFRRDAFVAGVAPSAGGRLPGPGDRGAGDGAECRAGLRWGGRTQGNAGGRWEERRGGEEWRGTR